MSRMHWKEASGQGERELLLDGRVSDGQANELDVRRWDDWADGMTQEGEDGGTRAAGEVRAGGKSAAENIRRQRRGCAQERVEARRRRSWRDTAPETGMGGENVNLLLPAMTASARSAGDTTRGTHCTMATGRAGTWGSGSSSSRSMAGRRGQYGDRERRGRSAEEVGSPRPAGGNGRRD